LRTETAGGRRPVEKQGELIECVVPEVVTVLHKRVENAGDRRFVTCACVLNIASGRRHVRETSAFEQKPHDVDVRIRAGFELAEEFEDVDLTKQYGGISLLAALCLRNEADVIV
jgi:hypothetical protein